MYDIAWENEEIAMKCENQYERKTLWLDKTKKKKTRTALLNK